MHGCFPSTLPCSASEEVSIGTYRLSTYVYSTVLILYMVGYFTIFDHLLRMRGRDKSVDLFTERKQPRLTS